MFFPDNILRYSRLLFACFMLFSVYSSLLAQQQSGISQHEIVSLFQKTVASYPQQKAFLHTDKTEYLAGETIWIKAYVAAATTNIPDTLSTNLYVELLNQKGDMAYMLLLRLDQGTAHGEMPIHDSIPGGNYRFRAYTDWMRNFDDDFLFTKDIYIHNPIEKNFIKRFDVFRNRRFNRNLDRKQEDMQFAFFPEGGHLVAGLENRVAFKAADALGAGVEAQGVILDDQNGQIAVFSTYFDGMGSFLFTPGHDKTYNAHISFSNGQQKRIKLPATVTNGQLLSVHHDNEDIVISVKRNFDHEAGAPANIYYLVVHTGGNVQFIDQFRFDDRLQEFTFRKEDLPGGISTVMLLDAHAVPLAERMIFISNNNIGQVHLTEKHIGKQADSQTLELKLEIDEHTGGSYSVAVLDTDSRSKKPRNNIAAEFLLFSDLAATRGNPAFYLDSDSEKAQKAVDLLMLTHFWRRFEWSNIIAGEFPDIRYGFPRGITIAGKVTPRSSSRETGSKNVELTVKHDRVDILNTTTDKQGNFSFTDLDYDGYFNALIRVEPGADRRAFLIELGGRNLSDIAFKANRYTRSLETTARSDAWERVPRPKTTMASRRSFIASPTSAGMYSDVDQVIYFDDIRDQYSRVIDVLETRVRGLVVDGGQILLRGPSSLIHNNEPLFLIDDQVVTRGQFLQTNIQEIDRLTVISGPQSAVFGSRGSNGALLLYTVRGDKHFYESFEYVVKGFHIPAQSFESKIFTAQYDNYNVSRSIFWEPNVQPNENNIIELSVSFDEDVRSARLIFQGVDETGKIFYSDFALDLIEHP